MINVSEKWKKLIMAFVLIYCFSSCFFAIAIIKGEDSLWSEGFSGDTLGKMSISMVYPVAAADWTQGEGGVDNPENIAQAGHEKEKDSQDQKAEKKPAKKDSKTTKAEAIPNDKNPQVLIYHTHATESYLPSKKGNYHTTEELNTVRDVGDVMMKYLKKEGIKVYHNRTLHDNPSYNASYDRSYQTIEELLQKYPSIECVIDLHRDAIPSSATAATVTVNGNTCARYAYVIGQGAPNYQANTSFVNKLNANAKTLYGDFEGNVLTRGYIYNQNLHNKSVLLEMGNNRNQIEEVRNTARYLAKVIAKTLKE